MVEWWQIYLAAILGYLTAGYIHSFIFAAFKANRYEDTLADKIAKRVVADLKQITEGEK